MKDGMKINDINEHEPWELNLVIDQIMEYNDPNIEIIHPPKSVEKTKQKHKKKEMTGTKKDTTGSRRSSPPSTSRKLRSSSFKNLNVN